MNTPLIHHDSNASSPQHPPHYEQNVHYIFLKRQSVSCDFMHLHSLAEDHLSNSGFTIDQVLSLLRKAMEGAPFGST
jgi:hypothetical protein